MRTARPRPPRAPAPAAVLFISLLLLVASPSSLASWSSSPRPAPPLDEVVRDAPLYPPLQGLESLDYYEQPPPNPPYETNKQASDVIVTPEQGKDFVVTPEKDVTGETEQGTNVQNEVVVDNEDVQDDPGGDDVIEERKKRSADQDWNKTKATSGRVRTGDTILNIRGVVQDHISDARAPPRAAAPAPPAPASRLDTVVIRPAAASLRPPLEPIYGGAKTTQIPRDDRELLVEAHSRARIVCDLLNVTDIKWYKDGEPIILPWGSHSGDVSWRESGGLGGEAVVVARATRGDAARWRCTGKDVAGRTITAPPIDLLIYEASRAVYLSVDGRRLDAGNTWVPARDAASLPVRCHAEGGVPAPELSWRLQALDPALDSRPYLRVQQTNYTVAGVTSSLAVVRAARELHNATLTCVATQRTPAPRAAPASPAAPAAPAAPAGPAASGEAELSAKLEIHVTYPPSFVISRWPGFGVSLRAGGAAALRCDVDANPPAKAWWQRDDTRPTSPPEPQSVEGGAANAATLRYPTLLTSHAGWYRCRASWQHQDYSSIGYYLNVLPPEEGQAEPVTPATAEAAEEPPEHQKVDVPVGGNVQLNCPKGSVGCWSRRDNASASWSPAGSHHAHGVLGIKDALYQEAGEYRCVGARGSDMARVRELKRVTLRVTGGATATALSASPVPSGGWRLACGACGRGVRVWWLRGGGAGRGGGGERAALVPDLAPHCWRAELRVHDAEEVWCVAVGAEGGSVAVFPPRPAPARRAAAAAPLPGAAARTALLLASLATTWLRRHRH